MKTVPDPRTSPPSKKVSDEAVLYPSTAIELKFAKFTAIAEAFPVGARHLTVFTRNMASFAQTVKALIDSQGPNGELQPRTLAMSLIPLLSGDLLQLVDDVVVITPNEEEFQHLKIRVMDLAHWHLPAIIDAVIEQSFADPNCLRPWVQVIDGLVTRVTGEPSNLWDELSQAWSEPASNPASSSTTDSLVSPTAE